MRQTFNFGNFPIKPTQLAIMGMLLMLLIAKQQYINPPQTVIEVGCSNHCSFGYNQELYPSCKCILSDTDNDGYVDLDEIEARTNPLDPTDFPRGK